MDSTTDKTMASNLQERVQGSHIISRGIVKGTLSCAGQENNTAYGSSGGAVKTRQQNQKLRKRTVEWCWAWTDGGGGQ